MSETLNVASRDALGTSNSRRMRKAGQIPAVLYGHGKETVHLSVAKEELDAVMRHGTRVVDLSGALTESALLRDVQWDAFGHDVLHIDLTRVEAGESVEISVPVELRGTAPGVKEGGIVEQPVHEVELECPVANIPEKLVVTINALQLGESITADKLELPPGARLLLPGDLDDPAELVIVHCVEPSAEPEAEEAGLGAEAAEPELIGRKEEDEGESED